MTSTIRGEPCCSTCTAWRRFSSNGGPTIEVQTAGLCHACYGTDGFAPALLSLRERDVLQARVGARVEAWVYLYASCDRAFVYRELATSGPLRFRDRFTGETSVVHEDDAAVLAELTAANELDIVTVNPEWCAEIGPSCSPSCAGRAIV